MLHVACAVEGAYDAHSAVMLRSAIAHSPRGGIHLHYLHGPGFPAGSLEKIAGMARRDDAGFSSYEIAPARVARLPVVDEFTVAMWYRIFLPDLLPDADRVLYLDVDTLALEALEPLFATDLSGHYLGAVTNVLMPHHRHRPESLGLSGPEVYFNSGVLLMNLEEMRRDDCATRLHDFAAEQGPALEWPDQDALNVVLGSRRVALHPRWNAMNSLRFPWAAEVHDPQAIAEARRRPAIRHFEGPDDNKPWHAGCDRDDRALYYRHRRKTPWRRERVEGTPSRLRQVAGSARRRLKWP